MFALFSLTIQFGEQQGERLLPRVSSDAQFTREPQVPVVGPDHFLGSRVIPVAETPVGYAKFLEPRTAVEQQRDGGRGQRYAARHPALLVHCNVQDAEMGEGVHARKQRMSVTDCNVRYKAYCRYDALLYTTAGLYNNTVPM